MMKTVSLYPNCLCFCSCPPQKTFTQTFFIRNTSGATVVCLQHHILHKLSFRFIKFLISLAELLFGTTAPMPPWWREAGICQSPFVYYSQKEPYNHWVRKFLLCPPRFVHAAGLPLMCGLTQDLDLPGANIFFGLVLCETSFLTAIFFTVLMERNWEFLEEENLRWGKSNAARFSH